MIQGASVRDYAYMWIIGACPLHQWCSGARGVDQGVIDHVEDMILAPRDRKDSDGLSELYRYLVQHKGCPAEPYVPDQWNSHVRCHVVKGVKQTILKGGYSDTGPEMDVAIDRLLDALALRA
jgi:hypothetical protein